jgi:hypothetical protein
MAYVQWLRERSSSRWQALRRPDSSLEPEGKERSCRARLVSRAKAAGQAATNDARRCEQPTCSWISSGMVMLGLVRPTYVVRMSSWTRSALVVATASPMARRYGPSAR